MTVAEFENELKKNTERCDFLIQELKSAQEEYSVYYRLLKKYLYLKFMLFDGEEDTEDILKLAEYSVENIAQLKRGGLQFKDRSGTCGSISSGVVKKILLMISLQNALGIQFEKNETADITTISELTEHVMDHVFHRGACHVS